MLLKGKTAIVTGGSLGIGSAIAVVLGREGANVALNYRKHSEEAERVAGEVGAAGGKGIAVQADVSNFDDAQAMVARVRETFGGLDILVNNAGVNRDRTIWKMSEEEWDTVIAINLKGYFNYIRAAAPLFKEQKGGKIVNVTSINGLRGKFGQSNYSASKAGIIGLTKTLAKEFAARGVAVNAVAPGFISTAMTETLSEDVREKLMEMIPFKRFGQGEDVANVVFFLLSDLASYVTGQVLNCDGGMVMAR